MCIQFLGFIAREPRFPKRLEPKDQVGHLSVMHRSSQIVINFSILPISVVVIALSASVLPLTAAPTTEAESQRLLYVGAPGIRDYLEYGGHGVLVFDIDHGHRFLKRIPFG